MGRPRSPSDWIGADGLCDLLCLSMSVLLWMTFCLLFVPTSEFRGCMSNSVELCPMPFGIPAVRYMAPTVRLFLASFAAFISSTVTPSSAKFCTPGLAGAPSAHSRKWRLWLTAKRNTRKENGARYLFTGMHITVSEVPQSLSQTMRSFLPWSLMYFYGCLLLPALKRIILKKLPTCLQYLGHYYRVIAISCLHLWQIKPQYRQELPGERSGSQSWQPDGGQKKLLKWFWKPYLILFLTLWANRTICFTFSYLGLITYEICWESRDWFRFNCLYHRFWSAVLKPTEPLAWASGYKGRVRLARNTLTNALKVLPYLTFQSGVHNHAFTLKHFWHMY